MNYEITQTRTGLLIAALVEELSRGARLIGCLEDSVYCRKSNGAGNIGAHFRHNLDFANAFLNGLGEGKIDYHRRERDTQIEENRLYAVKGYELTIAKLRNLPEEFLEKEVLVRSEIAAEVWLASSAARELEFLHSHTVHHHALIAEKLAFYGVETAEDFGVAPSTLKFWKEQNAARAA